MLVAFLKFSGVYLVSVCNYQRQKQNNHVNCMISESEQSLPWLQTKRNLVLGRSQKLKKGAHVWHHDGRVKLLWRSGTVRNEMGAQGRWMLT